jgi:hypothetical protein
MDSQVVAATQQAIQSVNEELALFVACDRFTAWRDGKTDDLGDTADYQVQSKLKSQNGLSSPETITRLLNTSRTTVAATLAQN